MQSRETKPSHTMSPLIDAANLTQRLAASPSPQALCVLDTRFNLAQPQAGEQAFAAGHIPGAQYVHLDRDLSAAKTGPKASGGRHPLPTPEAFAATARSWGLTPQTHVVAYDDQGGMFAARLWWMLRWLGHDAVQVLDGGWRAWLAAGGDSSTAGPEPVRPGSWQARPREGWRLQADEVLAGVQGLRPQCLIDARAADRFRGENETLDPVGGHIPGARNRFFQLNLQADGLFKPAGQLREEFTALLQGQPLDTVVHQCGSGVTACHNLLAMAAAGLPPTALYAGSWSEWCSDPARPVAQGEA
jgi:thiosulfate/3-mercaptopyruvate sulfurtransferase